MSLVIILPLVLVVLVLLLILFMVAPAMRRHPDIDTLRGLYIAHRGLHDIFENTPENSIAAFLAAAEHGFAIENDIHLTADGHVVVFHDDDLFRMCGVHGKPEDMTLSQLKELRLCDTEERIPTLGECLAAIDGRVALLIEFKCNSGSAAPLCEAADKILSGYKGKYFVQSFYPPVLLWYRKHRKDVCRGQLSTLFIGEAIVRRMLGRLLFNFLSRPDFVSYEFSFAKTPMRKLCGFLGAFPVGWTFRSEEDVSEAGGEFETYIFEGFLPK